MDIDYNPIPDTGLDGIGTNDPFGQDDTITSEKDDDDDNSRNDYPQKSYLNSFSKPKSTNITNLSWINSPSPSPEPSPGPPAALPADDNSVDASWINR